MFDLAADGRIVAADGSYAELFERGFEPVGRALLDVLPLPRLDESLARVRQGECARVLEGSLVSAGARLRVTLIPAARLAGACCVAVVERILESPPERPELDDLIRGLNVVVWEADDRRRLFSFSSPHVEAMFGYPVASWTSRPHFWRSVLHADDRDQAVAAIAALDDDEDQDFECRIVRADGSVQWVRDIARVFRDETGTRRLRGVFVDVSRRKRAEEAAVLSESQLRRLHEISRLGSWTLDLGTERLELSRMAACILGLPAGPGVIESGGFLELVHPEDREAVRAHRLAARAAGTVQRHDYRVRTAAGDERVIHEQAEAVLDAANRAIRLVGTVEDVSEHRRAQQERALLTSVVEQSTESVMITTRDGAIVYVNPTFETITGYASEEVLGRTPRLLASGRHDWRFFDHMWRTVLAGRVWTGEITNRRKDGTIYTEELTITPVRDHRGEIGHFISSGRDTTTRRELEAQLRQSQKMEAIGRLAGGIAHDFSNLLTVIRGHAERLRGGAENPVQQRAAESVAHAAKRASALTQQLLAFSRRQMLLPKVLDLNAVIGGMNRLLRGMIGEDIELVWAPAANLDAVRADPSQIEQVLMNLAVNARDAMPSGGRLTLETANVTLDEAYGHDHAPVVPGRYVLLAVSDTGVGMDPSVRARIFEPFFTTKEQGKGTGLGLSTVYGIVKQSGGYIWAYSEVGMGTTFKIYLPRVEQQAESLEPAPVRGEAPRGTETILLVEDEEGVRELVEEILTDSGYRVLAAVDVDDAQRLAEEHAASIDLLITDVVMPRMSGVELARRVAVHRPVLPVLYMSGYADTAIVQRGMVDENLAFLAKPFSRDSLTRKVRDVIDGAAGGRGQ